jgi:hypothetical protein
MLRPLVQLRSVAVSGKMFRMKQFHTHLTNIELRHKLNNACLVTQSVPFGEGSSSDLWAGIAGDRLHRLSGEHQGKHLIRGRCDATGEFDMWQVSATHFVHS